MEQIRRYALASAGPVASAGAQFLLSLLLLRMLGARDFGSFSFLLVTAQLMQGIWGALFCAPLLIVMTHGTGEVAARKAAILGLSLVLAVLAAVPLAAIGWVMKLPSGVNFTFSFYTAATLVRWVGRTHAYASGKPVRAMASDMIYALALVASLGIVMGTGQVSMTMSFAILLLAILIGFLPLGRDFLHAQFFGWRLSDLRHYAGTWRQHASWSLLGVVTTEVTANSQVYLVTALFGPAAFAPIAATALLIRPCNVAVNALSEFERAQMARSVGAGDVAAARRMIGGFRGMLAFVWAGTGIATAALLLFAPRLLFPAHYPLESLITGACLWLLVIAVRFARAPESSLLQAGGAFRPLAFASVISCAFSLLGVLILLLAFGPLWSIMGTFIGEVVFAAWTWREARRWQPAGAKP
ncbi:hypothetical protein C1T17_18925 [Sphingobium sp. SCG-1]|uniref:hypothetical protein n=1 Tax=Sphingobium sp. SCG-1 TaxID=2072936 RepID=UPI000CD6B668|nr:hypothetical protein [Sphingobium sp. SCG-1]AUW59841.1 hypothetical protein C1T17_18925 [Sphingobium sp. SCG-1]